MGVEVVSADGRTFRVKFRLFGQSPATGQNSARVMKDESEMLSERVGRAAYILL